MRLKSRIISMSFIILLVAVSIISIQTCGRKAAKVVQYEHIIQHDRDTITYYKDKEDQTHAVVPVLTATISQLSGKYDSLLKVLKIKERQLQEVTNIGITASNTIEPTVIREKDTCRYHLSYADQSLKLQGIISDAGSVIDYTYTDSLIVSQYWKRKHWYSGKEYFIDAFSNNTKAKITGLNNVRLPAPRQKRWGLGLNVGYHYVPIFNQWYPTAGVGIQYNLLMW